MKTLTIEKPFKAVISTANTEASEMLQHLVFHIDQYEGVGCLVLTYRTEMSAIIDTNYLRSVLKDIKEEDIEISRCSFEELFGE